MSEMLTPKQRKAVLALVEHGSVTEAAQAAGVARQTLHKWMLLPEFAQALREATASQMEQASRELTSLMSKAVAVLGELMEAGFTDSQRRLAADSIISHALRLRELVELESRVVALEARNGK